MSEDCELGQLRDSLIKGIIIIGLRNKNLQEKLLGDPDIDLSQVCKRSHASEVTKLQAKAIQGTNKETSNIEQLSSQNQSKFRKNVIKSCKFYAGTHSRGNCPAWAKFVIVVKKLDIWKVLF